MGLEPETEYKITATCFSDIAESEPTEEITVTTTALPKITKINVPQRLDLYVDETKQLDVSAVPVEAMRAYGHVNKAVLDNSIVKFDGDNVSGIKSVNDEVLGRNLWAQSDAVSGYVSATDGKITPTPHLPEHRSSSNLIKLDSKSKLIVQIWNYTKLVHTSNTNRCAFFDENKKWIKNSKNFGLTGKEYEYHEIEIPPTCRYVRLGFIQGKNGKLEEKSIKIKVVQGNKATDWTPAPEDNYSYTSANVTFNDADKSSTEFDIFVHKREHMTSPTKADVASFIL